MIKRSLTAAVLVAATGTIAACSNDPGEATAPTTDNTSTSAAVTPSTTPPPTTPTTVEPTSTTLTDEEAVRLVHTRFMTELFARDERIDGPEVVLPLAEELTTGPLLARIEDSVARSLASGERSVSSGYDSNIVDLLIEGERASVLDCSSDTGTRYSSDGEVLLPPSTEYRVRETRLIRSDSGWLIEEFVIGGGEICSPSDSL